jgi:HD domain-containing protein
VSTAGATGPTRAEELVSTDAEKAALAVVVEQAGEASPLEGHAVRLFRFVEMLAAERGVEIDRELVLVTALLHDIGLYDDTSHGGVYVTDGAEFTRALLEPFGWDEERLRLCFDSIEKHHELRAQWDKGDEVELVRRADQIEVMNGAVVYGLPRSEVRRVMREVPRKGFYPAVGKLLLKAARERPTTLPRIFLR